MMIKINITDGGTSLVRGLIYIYLYRYHNFSASTWPFNAHKLMEKKGEKDCVSKIFGSKVSSRFKKKKDK